jgi:phosphate-selective porin OprO/OprP
MLLKSPGVLLAVGLGLGLGQHARAQSFPAPEPGPTQNQSDDVKARLDRLEKQHHERIEQLEKQNRDLQETLQRMQTIPTSPPVALPAGGQPTSTSAAQGPSKEEVQNIVNDVLKARDDQVKAKVAAAKQQEEIEGYKVGTALGATASWVNGSQLWFSTRNKDFILHIGGWFQNDEQWWGQNGAFKKPVAAGGVGEWVDGDAFRRIRIQMDGTFWEICEFNCIYSLENNTFNTVPVGTPVFNQIGIDEFYFGVMKLPVLGTVRFGHQKIPNGLEGDCMSSSRVMMFEERASFSDAFYFNFATGVRWQNNWFDDRLTAHFMWYRPDLPNLNTGDSFQDGTYGYTGRLAVLPWYCDDGRRLFHLAASGTYRVNPHGGLGAANFPGARFAQVRARPELRDSDANNDTVPGGNGNRLVDTGVIASDSTACFGLESALVYGPFSVQAEWAWNTVNNATSVTDSLGNTHALTGGSYTFQGGYIAASYFLTGEHRAWNKRDACWNSVYLGKDGPNTQFFAVRGDDNHFHWGLGAIELCARYSYLDLNAGTGKTAVTGGIMNGVNAGINWHLNNNLKVQFDYLYNTRQDTIQPGVDPGNLRAFVIRTQLNW